MRVPFTIASLIAPGRWAASRIIAALGSCPHKTRIFLRRFRAKPKKVEAVPDLAHSTSPDAKVNLFLRFDTQDGPLTIVAHHVPRQKASAIKLAMIANKQYAAFVEERASFSLGTFMKKHKRKMARKKTPVASKSNVVAMPKAARRGP